MEFLQSRPAFQGGLLVAVASAIPNLSSFEAQGKILSLWRKVPLRPSARKLCSQSCLFATLSWPLLFPAFSPSLAARCPLSSGLEGSGTVRTLNLFFMHSRERESEQECCRQDTSGPFLTTFHEFKSPVLKDAKATAEKGVGEGRGKGVC